MSYAIRTGDRTARLPYKTLDALAQALGLTAAERSKFVLLGLKQHAPSELLAYITWLEADNRRLRTARGEHEPVIELRKILKS
jgi:hypothetical protein